MLRCLVFYCDSERCFRCVGEARRQLRSSELQQEEEQEEEEEEKRRGEEKEEDLEFDLFEEEEENFISLLPAQNHTVSSRSRYSSLSGFCS